MALKDRIQGVRDKAMEFSEQAGELSGLAADKVNELVDDYRCAVESLERYGFEVTRFHVGLGVLPEIDTTVRGSIADLDEAEVSELIEKNEDRKILVAMLNALLMAREVQLRAGLADFGKVALDVKLGLPPSVAFSLEPS